MKHHALLLLILSSLACSPAYSGDGYKLDRCVVKEKSVYLRFVTDHGAVRRITLGPKGVSLSGDVKGSARLSQVKELRLAPKLEIVFVSGPSVEFGAITSECRHLVRQVGKSLVPLRDVDG